MMLATARARGARALLASGGARRLLVAEASAGGDGRDAGSGGPRAGDGGGGGKQGGRRGGKRQGRNKYADKRPPRAYRDKESGLYEGGPLNAMFTKQPNSGFVPLDLRDELYRLHKEDPDGKGEVGRLAAMTGLPIPKVLGIIKIRAFELEREAENGAMLDYTMDQEVRKHFGEFKSWKGRYNKDELLARMRQDPPRYNMMRKEKADEFEKKASARAGDAPWVSGLMDRWGSRNKYHGEKIMEKKPGFVFLHAGSGPKPRPPAPMRMRSKIVNKVAAQKTN